MTQFTTNPKLTELINEAQAVGIKKMDGHHPTPRALEQLSSYIKGAIIRQAALGRWREVGVTDPDHLMRLRVTARLGKGNESPIVIDYDFTKTKIAHAIVTTVTL